MQKTIYVSGLEVNILRKNIKHLHLNILPPTGKIRVSVPEKTEDEVVRLFVISKLSRIKKEIQIFQNQERQSIREYITGESHYFKGNRYLLNVIYHNSQPKVEIKNKQFINFYIKKELTRKQREKAFYSWYREELKKILPQIVTKWEKIIGVKPNECKIKIMKTKWGACNSKSKRIWINLELIKKPLIHFEYIVLHELIHLIENTHNSIFIMHMDKFMPNWRKHKQELNDFILAYDKWNE